MAAILPAIEGKFIYNGDLFVDVGNMNRHKRASVHEISDLLRPDLRKGQSSPPAKDPPAHWWEAQLLHYGLPSTKDKARAKLRLLEKLTSLSLKIPPEVIQIETKLKKDFSAAQRKVKAHCREVLVIDGPDPNKSTRINKRKEMGTSLDHVHAPASQISLPASKKIKNVPARPRSPSPIQLLQDRPKPRTKQTARKQVSRNHGPQPPFALHRTPLLYEDDQSPSQSVPSSDSKSQTIPKTPKPKKEPKSKPDSNVKTEPKTTAPKNPTVKKESKPKEPGIAVNKKGDPTQLSTFPPPGPAKPPLGLINGIYDITCPSIEREWPCTPMTLTLTLDSPHIWGAYDFSMFYGILHLPKRPARASSRPIEFQWRGRDSSEGMISCGEGNTGEIKFLGGGGIEGRINLYGECSFHGVRRDGSGTPVRAAADMWAEWDDYNEEAYEAESVGRWH